MKNPTILTVRNSCIRWRRKVIHIPNYSVLYLKSWILSQLNILCSSLIKSHFTKTTICPLFTVHTLRPFHAFSNILDLMKAESSIHLNIQYFIWSKNSVFNFTVVRYSLHKCSENILYLKQQFTVHVSPVSCAREFMEARKTCYRVVMTSTWSISYSEELCSQNSIVKTSATFIVWSAFCYTAGFNKSDAIESGARPTAKQSDGV